MNDELIFLPQPQKVSRHNEGYLLQGEKLIQLIIPQALEMHFSALRLQKIIKIVCGLDWEIAAGTALPNELVGITLCIDPQAVLRQQAYELTITAQSVRIIGHEAAGVFYGVNTLIQIIGQNGLRLPGMSIADWPDFLARGVMLDISRDKVYSMPTLYNLVDMLAGWKVNQLQLYTEHTFAYRKHPAVWSGASPMTGQEILELDRYCKERFIELVPNQNSFGHMHRWLTQPRYAPLAETHGTFMAPWGEMTGPFSLCPIDPRSLELVCDLYDELLPHFSSRTVNVGCDEAVDLGQGRSKDICEKFGIGQVYLDYLLKIHREVNRRGFRMQYWGDIIIHYPDLIPSLPADATALEWGYEADHPFGPHAQKFAQAGIPFYLCPGTSAWNSIAGRTTNALANLKSAAENGLAYGAVGYLNTDWGDNGHWQPLPVSYLGMAMGAAYSWAYFANKDRDAAQTISLHAFQDASGAMGKVAYNLGEIYQTPGLAIPNSSALFWLLQLPVNELRKFSNLRMPGLDRTLQEIDLALASLDRASMNLPDGDLIQREFRLAAKMLRHAARRGKWFLAAASAQPEQAARTENQALIKELDDIVDEYRAVWLLRNRAGGLAESAGRLELIRKDYQRSTV